jgi:hypothetical protein
MIFGGTEKKMHFWHPMGQRCWEEIESQMKGKVKGQ